jgi:hypothetical protein
MEEQSLAKRRDHLIPRGLALGLDNTSPMLMNTKERVIRKFSI